jgi:hypothetical protein
MKKGDRTKSKAAEMRTMSHTLYGLLATQNSPKTKRSLQPEL